MAGHSLTTEQQEERCKAYDDAVAQGYVPKGGHIGTGKTSAVTASSRSLDVNPRAIHLALEWRDRRDKRGGGAPSSASPVQSINPEEARRERADAGYWRRKAAELDDALAKSEAALRTAQGIIDRPASPPQWSTPKATGKPSRVAGLLHISDLHVGEVVRPDEIAGSNEYDPDVFVRRIRRLFAASVEIIPRWAADSALAGVVVAVNGDLTSGDIHDELRRTNALTAFEQAYLVTDELTAGVTALAEEFGHVWATFTPGNHGRSTDKTHAKRTAALSYDMLVGEMVRRHFVNDPRVTVMLAQGPDLEYPIFGWNVFQSHGDALGTGGGKGFAGPVLPIARGAKNVEWQAYRLHKRHDIILTAHYHTSSNPARGVLANGSVVGFNEYANRIRAGIEPPQQWLALIHERWGIRERCEIQLETDNAPEKPRVRVPAGMGAA